MDRQLPVRDASEMQSAASYSVHGFLYIQSAWRTGNSECFERNLVLNVLKSNRIDSRQHKPLLAYLIVWKSVDVVREVWQKRSQWLLYSFAAVLVECILQLIVQYQVRRAVYFGISFFLTNSYNTVPFADCCYFLRWPSDQLRDLIKVSTWSFFEQIKLVFIWWLLVLVFDGDRLLFIAVVIVRCRYQVHFHRQLTQVKSKTLS